MVNLLATLAEYERELITERVNTGIAAVKASATVPGRSSPPTEHRPPTDKNHRTGVRS